METILTGIVSTILAGLVIYFGNAYWKKYIFNRPKLYIDIPVVLFSQTRGQGTLSDFTFCWKPQIKLKNNSSYTAYNVQLSFPTGYELSDGQSLNYIFPPNNHIEPNAEKEFELKTCLIKRATEVIPISRENGGLVIHPGTKIPNPQQTLKPIKARDIRINLKYENEKGGQFYTFFREGKNQLK